MFNLHALNKFPNLFPMLISAVLDLFCLRSVLALDEALEAVELLDQTKQIGGWR